MVGTFGRVTGMCWASWPGIPLDGPKALEGRKVSVSSSLMVAEGLKSVEATVNFVRSWSMRALHARPVRD